MPRYLSIEAENICITGGSFISAFHGNTFSSLGEEETEYLIPQEEIERSDDWTLVEFSLNAREIVLGNSSINYNCLPVLGQQNKIAFRQVELYGNIFDLPTSALTVALDYCAYNDPGVDFSTLTSPVKIDFNLEEIAWKTMSSEGSLTSVLLNTLFLVDRNAHSYRSYLGRITVTTYSYFENEGCENQIFLAYSCLPAVGLWKLTKISPDYPLNITVDKSDLLPFPYFSFGVYTSVFLSGTYYKVLTLYQLPPEDRKTVYKYGLGVPYVTGLGLLSRIEELAFNKLAKFPILGKIEVDNLTLYKLIKTTPLPIAPYMLSLDSPKRAGFLPVYFGGKYTSLQAEEVNIGAETAPLSPEAQLLNFFQKEAKVKACCVNSASFKGWWNFISANLLYYKGKDFLQYFDVPVSGVEKAWAVYIGLWLPANKKTLDSKDLSTFYALIPSYAAPASITANWQKYKIKIYHYRYFSGLNSSENFPPCSTDGFAITYYLIPLVLRDKEGFTQALQGEKRTIGYLIQDDEGPIIVSTANYPTLRGKYVPTLENISQGQRVYELFVNEYLNRTDEILSINTFNEFSPLDLQLIWLGQKEGNSLTITVNGQLYNKSLSGGAPVWGPDRTYNSCFIPCGYFHLFTASDTLLSRLFEKYTFKVSPIFVSLEGLSLEELTLQVLGKPVEQVATPIIQQITSIDNQLQIPFYAKRLSQEEFVLSFPNTQSVKSLTFWDGYGNVMLGLDGLQRVFPEFYRKVIAPIPKEVLDGKFHVYKRTPLSEALGQNPYYAATFLWFNQTTIGNPQKDKVDVIAQFRKMYQKDLLATWLELGVLEDVKNLDITTLYLHAAAKQRNALGHWLYFPNNIKRLRITDVKGEVEIHLLPGIYVDKTKYPAPKGLSLVEDVKDILSCPQGWVLGWILSPEIKIGPSSTDAIYGTWVPASLGKDFYYISPQHVLGSYFRHIELLGGLLSMAYYQGGWNSAYYNFSRYSNRWFPIILTQAKDGYLIPFFDISAGQIVNLEYSVRSMEVLNEEDSIQEDNISVVAGQTEETNINIPLPDGSFLNWSLRFYYIKEKAILFSFLHEPNGISSCLEYGRIVCTTPSFGPSSEDLARHTYYSYLNPASKDTLPYIKPGELTHHVHLSALVFAKDKQALCKFLNDPTRWKVTIDPLFVTKPGLFYCYTILY